MTTREQVHTNARLAGAVRRYHTWPMLQQQTVADHSFHVMRIYWQIFGPLPPEVSTAILWHDMGELVTGDAPFPLKAKHPVLKVHLDALEEAAVGALNGNHKTILPGNWAQWVKLCDLIEMLEMGLMERMLGNKYADPIINDIAKAVNGMMQLLEFTPKQKVWDYLRNLRSAYGDY